jgi:hypothetical protein
MRNTMSTTATNSHQTPQNASPRKQMSPNDRTCAIVCFFSPQPRYEGSDRSAVEFLSKLLLEIASLKERLDRPEQQDFYFRKGIEANKQKLSSLIPQFNTLRKEVNAANRCALADEIKCVKEFLVCYKKHSYAGFIQSVVINNKSSQIRHLEILLGLKTAVGVIKPLGHYLNFLKTF